MFPIVSVLAEISTLVFKCQKQTELPEVKKQVKQLLNDSKVKEVDKLKMIQTLMAIPTVVGLQRYIANALLKYEGLGLAQLEKPLEKGTKPTTDSYEMDTNQL